MKLEDIKSRTKDAVDYLVQSLDPGIAKCSPSISERWLDSIPTRSAMSC
jgi:hypothetical protein